MANSPTGSVGDLLAELKNNYAAELGNKVDEIELQLLKLQQPSHFQEAVRQIHSMKGTAGTYGFMQVSTICHHLEDELALITPGQSSHEDIDRLLQYVDLLRQVERRLQHPTGVDINIEQALAKLRQPRHVLRIMLVDGSKTIPALIRDALSQPNVELKCMEDGYLALGVLLMQHYDLLITSEEIGNLGGRALISALRENGSALRGIKTVLLTSNVPTAKQLSAKADWLLHKDANLTRQLGDIVRGLAIPA